MGIFIFLKININLMKSSNIYHRIVKIFTFPQQKYLKYYNQLNNFIQTKDKQDKLNKKFNKFNNVKIISWLKKSQIFIIYKMKIKV